MTFALGDINEALADAIPDQEAIVTAGHRLTWRDLQLRSRKIADILSTAGLGCRRERQALQPWESGQDHLALYLYNGHEYLEAMVGAFKARVAPFNVNYRYVEEELYYLLSDAATRAIVYHASFAPRLARVLARLPAVALLLQVDDGSGEPLLPGAIDYEAAVSRASDARPAAQASEDDLYILYTGGTTGAPKGVLWRQGDIFFAAMGGQLPWGLGKVRSVEELVERAPAGAAMRLLPGPPFMHNAAQWSAFITLHNGGTVIIPASPRALDADDIWRTVEKEKAMTLSIVGDAFARPLLDRLRAGNYDLSSLAILGSGGAVFSAQYKRAFLELLPNLTIVDGFGSSETGAQGSSMTRAGDDEVASTTFGIDDHTVVLDAELERQLEPGEEQVGWLARRGHVPLGYLNDEAKTTRTYPVVAGVRYSVPGDRVRLASDGKIEVCGRDSTCINTGGEKVFAQEVEEALKNHPAVYDVLVTGVAHERWGEQVTAVVALRPGSHVGNEELLETASRHLARFKLPKAFVFVDAIARSASGKPDYRWAKDTALAALADAEP